METTSHRDRVLLLTPTGRDAALISETLTRNGLRSQACPDARRTAEEAGRGAGALLVAEEAVTSDALTIFSAVLRAQPAWSDLPVLILSSSGESTAMSNQRVNPLGELGNVTVIERPVRPATLISLVRTALRARHRQYEVERLFQDLQVTQDRLRTMIESAHDYAIINLDPDGCITYWNAGAERLLGYSEESALGRQFDMVFAQEDRRAGIPRDQMQMALRIGRAESEGWRIRPDGSRFWASGVLRPTRDSAGNVTGFVKVLRDMTEQKRSQELLADQSLALQRSNEDLQRFAYVASHDLQEPLRIIGSYSQLLIRKNAALVDDDSRQFVRFIVGGVEQLRTLIRDLLEFSRLANQQNHAPEPVDCHAVLGLALQNLQFKISESGARITFDRLPRVLGHEMRLLQVFQNLIGNALKYCEGVPAVHISANRGGDFWCISVQDNGIGIAPEHQEKVFGLFQRLHSKSEYPGSGIGLATCKRIVEQHGGRIWVESAKGKGSTFRLTLPDAELAGHNDSRSRGAETSAR